MPVQESSPFGWNALSSFARRVASAALVLALCAFAVDAIVGDRGLVAGLRARDDYQRLASDLERLRNENAQMRQEIRQLREDPSRIEEVARRDLGLMNPGEKLFIIRDVPQPDPRLPAAKRD